MVTDYPSWHARHRPTLADGRAWWPAFGELAGYRDGSWLVQAHYLHAPQDACGAVHPSQEETRQC